jgi:hypothetical protein
LNSFESGFLGLSDPDPSIISKNSKENLDFTVADPDPACHLMRIRILLVTLMRIRILPFTFEAELHLNLHNAEKTRKTMLTFTITEQGA